MEVFLTTAYPYHPRTNFVATFLEESFQNDPFGIHELVSQPENADLIIFTEHHPSQDPYFLQILKDKIYKKYKNKCYLYHDSDHSLTFIPTVSPSIRLKNFNPIFHYPFSYIVQIETNSYLENGLFSDSKKKYLFSFIGAARTNSIREKIFSLENKNSFLQDTSDLNSWELPKQERETYFKKYAQISQESKFILCPAGIGPNSYRLYESLRMGIPPVIISDDWIPSNGPKWENFSIRILEKEIEKIPEILTSKENEAFQMGQLAKQAWEDFFAKNKQFHFLVEACLTLHETRIKVDAFTYLQQISRFKEPYHIRNLLRWVKNNITFKLKSLPKLKPIK